MTDGSPCFIHAADLHLGAPLDALGGRVAPEKARHLRELAATAMERLVELAVARRAAFVVLAGDLYDSADREVAAQLRLHRALEALDDAGIATFVVHGNHDPLSASYLPVRRLPPSVTVFGPGEVTEVEVALADGRLASVAGISYAQQRERENLAARFGTLARASGRPVVGVLHANVGSAPGHDPYAPCTEADLAAAPVDYWALGHVHARSVRPLGPGRWWAYPGNLQGRSSKPSECGEKGALVVPIEGGVVGEPEFVACDAVRFERADVPIAGAEDLGEVLDRLREVAVGAAGAAGGRPVLLHARLVGDGDVHHALRPERHRLVDLAREELGSVLGDGELVRVRDETGPPVDRAQLVGRGDLLAEVLGALDRTDRSGDELLGRIEVGEVGATTRALVVEALRDDPDAAPSLWAEVERLLVDALDGGVER